jgi:hypothetical protein
VVEALIRAVLSVFVFPPIGCTTCSQVTVFGAVILAPEHLFQNSVF